ncbi:WD40 repeat-like protein [Xylaria longipes]|nr:WD40 repeat-like protein [Xylaria longipes]
MTGPTLDSFQRALKRFQKALPPDLADEFSVCTLDDVRGICRNIQDAHGREGKLRHMRRLAPFIEAMEQFGKVIEVFTNVNDVVCFIWGPIKFLLCIARTHIDSFDKLLDMYDKIGNAIPGLQRYQAAFEKHPPLATVLEDYYSDILEFHQAALSVFRRPRWKELFHSTWKTFDSKFGPILQSMEKRRELLESEKGSATLYEIQQLRQDISDMYTKQRNQTDQENVEKHRREVSYIREKLEAPNYRIDQEMSTEDRHGHSSGTWIFEDPSFCSWSNNDTPGHGVLYVNGIPGAGKTTLMSVVIENFLDSKCSKEKRHCVAYFYFKQKQPNKVSHNSSLRALLLQLVERDSAISDNLFEKISSIDGVNLRSTKVLEGLVKTTLESYRISYIVLDGLDECAPNEAAKSVEWFLSLINGGLAGTNSTLRVLFCGQRDGTIDKLLSDQSSISLEASGHVEDIRQYCRHFCRRIREKFNISPVMEEDIILRVTNGAQGMFLYARVVLENLWNQTRLSRLRQEIEPGTFPQGIEKAYERVAVRIFEMSSMAEREDARRILGWIICARRLLRWREIQSLFCIDPVKGDVDYEERRLRVTCKELCGSLVDVHHATNKTSPEDIVKIVHETAREYLVQRKWLDASLEHARLAIFCSRYLTSPPFADGINEKAIVTNAVKGYYALQDYAVQYWFDHFRECIEVRVTLDPDRFLEVMAGARVFLESYGLPSKMGHCEDTTGHERVARAIAAIPGDSYERNEYLNIEHRTTLIRNTIETLGMPALGPTVQEILTNLHGNIISYKCTKPWCESFTVGFENAEDRKSHINRHDRPFRCPLESCFAFQIGYDTRAKLDQHKKKHHPEPDNEETRFPRINKKKLTIWAATEQGDLATVSTLLDSGEDVNQSRRTSGGETLLHLAAKSGHFEICKTFLKRGADINLVGPRGTHTALYAAVVAGELDIVHLLVSHKECRPDQTTLHKAVGAGNVDIVRLLISYGEDKPDQTGISLQLLFCEACALGHLGIVKLMLETGKIQPDLRPQIHPKCCHNEFYSSTLTPLGYACGEGRFSVVQYLLQQGQSDLVTMDVLGKAVRRGHDDIADLLVLILKKSSANGVYQRDLLSDLFIKYASIGFEKERDDWSVTFNPARPLVLDVDLTHTLHLQFQSSATCVCFSPNGKYLASGCYGFAQINIVATGERLCTLKGKYNVRSACFSPENEYLATGGDDMSITIWNVATRAIHSIFLGHQGAITALDFAHDGQTVASGSRDGTVRLWDLKTQAILWTLSIGDAYTCAISLDSKLIVAGYDDGPCHVWDIHGGYLIGNFGGTDGHKGGVYSIALSPNKRNFVSASSDMTIKMWDLTALQGASNQGPERSCIKTFEGHELPVVTVAITHDSQWVLSGSGDGGLRFWDYDTGQMQFILRGHGRYSIKSVASSPTGDYFATGASDQTVRIWSYTRV